LRRTGKSFSERKHGLDQVGGAHLGDKEASQLLLAWQVVHARRDANQVAHELAKLAIRLVSIAGVCACLYWKTWQRDRVAGLAHARVGQYRPC
jgi:hypothetical protein